MHNRTIRRSALALGALFVVAAEAFTLGAAAPPASQALALLARAVLRR